MSLFADKAAIVAEMRSDRLIVAGRTYFPGTTLSDDYIYAKVLAAERDIERRLRVFVEPVEVVPEGATQAERDALDEAQKRWIEEPGYDFGPEFFRGDSWGFILTRHRPIVAVHSIRFVYPQPWTGIFEIPADWIRLDRKYGHIRLVPGTQSFAAPLSAWVMQVLGGGRTIPHMIQVRYEAGIQNAATDFPDLVDLIKKLAVLAIIDDMYLPQSASISADGLSESFSVDAAKFAGKLETRIETLRQAIHGVRMMAL